ncbi:MAG TPA: hypothetical protein VFQ35_01235, partial [Polyangiaceae bacterium]|nr:hypothetical protein [Polyangiaceae bacterium]
MTSTATAHGQRGRDTASSTGFSAANVAGGGDELEVLSEVELGASAASTLVGGVTFGGSACAGP